MSDDFNAMFFRSIDKIFRAPDSPIFHIAREADSYTSRFQPYMSQATFEQMVETYLNNTLEFINIRAHPKNVSRHGIEIATKASEEKYFAARIRQNSKNSAEINISTGVYYALQDLILRSVSSENFFNNHSRDVPPSGRWQGSECCAAPTFNKPVLRYFDYTETGKPDNDLVTSTMLSEYDRGLAEAVGGYRTYSGTFVKKLPLSPERLYLADIMMNIALSWILMHEEAHVLLGHFNNHDEDGEVKVFDEVDFSPSSKKQILDNISNEYLADSTATNGVIELFLHESLLNILPVHSLLHMGWLIRLMLSSISIVILVVGRARMERKISNAYPSPRVRLFAAAKAIHHETILKLSGIKTEADGKYTEEQKSASLEKHSNEPEQQEYIYNGLISGLWDAYIAQELLYEDVGISQSGLQWAIINPVEHAPHVMGHFISLSNLGFLDQISDEFEMDNGLVEGILEEFSKVSGLSREVLEEEIAETLETYEELLRISEYSESRY